MPLLRISSSSSASASSPSLVATYCTNCWKSPAANSSAIIRKLLHYNLPHHAATVSPHWRGNGISRMVSSLQQSHVYHTASQQHQARFFSTFSHHQKATSATKKKKRKKRAAPSDSLGFMKKSDFVIQDISDVKSSSTPVAMGVPPHQMHSEAEGLPLHNEEEEDLSQSQETPPSKENVEEYEQLFSPPAPEPEDIHHEKSAAEIAAMNRPVRVQAHRVPEIIDIMQGNVACPGCGATMQTKNEDATGFIHPKALQTYIDDERNFRTIAQVMKNKKPSTMIDKGSLKQYERFSKKRHSLRCQRCHHLSHYKLVQDVPLPDYKQKLKRLKSKDVLLIYVVDIFDLENSLIENIRDLVGNKDIILVCNKTDLIPANEDENLLERQVRRLTKFHLQPSGGDGSSAQYSSVKDVILLSSWSKRNFKRLGTAIERHRNYRDVYIIGKTNVGKSTLTNSLVKYFGGSIVQTDESDPNADPTLDRPFATVTESEYPGTTLNNVALLIGGNQQGLKQRIFDTPGLNNDNLLIKYLSPSEWKCVYPKKRINPRYVAASPGKTLFIGGLIRIDFISNQVFQKQFEKITLVVYASNMMPVHLTRTDKADELYERRAGDFLFPPGKDNKNLQMDSFTDYIFESDTRKTNCGDIALPGFGWVSVNGAGRIRLRVHHPSVLKLRKREALLPDACVGVSPRQYETDVDFNRYKKRIHDLHEKQKIKTERKKRREERAQKRAR